MRLHLSASIALALAWPVPLAAQTPPPTPAPTPTVPPPAAGKPNLVSGDVGERGTAAKPAQPAAGAEAGAPNPPRAEAAAGPTPDGIDDILEDMAEAPVKPPIKLPADYGVSDNLSGPSILLDTDPFRKEQEALARKRRIYRMLEGKFDDVLLGTGFSLPPLTDEELRPPVVAPSAGAKPKCDKPPAPTRTAGDQPVESILDEIEPPTSQPPPKAEGAVSQAPALDPGSSALLAYHNQLRAKVGSPPLAWNAALAAHAAEYAQVMADSGQMVHSSRVGREKERENLALSPHGSNSANALVQLWGKEQALFRPGTFPSICAGDWSQCAHFTQMVWSTTTDVGCGFAQGRQFDALVCRYTPPGNRDGSPVIAPVAARPAVERCPTVAVAGSARD
jgi:hypothetical protein